MFDFLKSALSATGSTAEGYMRIMRNHAGGWEREQAINQAFAQKAHVAEVAKKMAKLANEISAIDPAVIAETNTLVTEALTARGLK